MEVNGNKVGIAAELTMNPSIVHSGAPTSETPAAVGQLYMDKDNGNLYKCTAFTDGAYVWEPVGGGSCVLTGSGAPTGDTPGEKGNLYVDTANKELYMCTAVYGSYHMWETVVPKTSESVTCTGAEYPSIKVGDEITTLAAADSEAAATINDCRARMIEQLILSLNTSYGQLEVPLRLTSLNGSSYYAGLALAKTSGWSYLLVHLSTNGRAITCKVVELATVTT